MTDTPAARARRLVRLSFWVDPVFDRVVTQHGVALTVLPTTGADEAIRQALADAHAYHVSAARDELPARWHVDAALLRDNPRLLFVSSSGAGFDTVDVQACTRAGVAVLNQAGGNAASVAEHTIGLILGVSRRMAESDRRLRAETGFSREDVMGHEIQGRTLGLVGIGHIGERVARLAAAFGLQVLACDPGLDDGEIARRGARPVTLPELLSASDIVSVHCPRDASTLNLFDARAFAAMKPGAIFITTARGGIHDEAALLDALRSGHLSGAGLDVWTTEPPALDHPLLALPNVFATFHTGGVTHEARHNMARIAAEQLCLALDGGEPPRIVNREVWPQVSRRWHDLFGN